MIYVILAAIAAVLYSRWAANEIEKCSARQLAWARKQDSMAMVMLRTKRQEQEYWDRDRRDREARAEEVCHGM